MRLACAVCAVCACVRVCMIGPVTRTDVPLALAAQPLGNVSLQKALQEIFELRSERVWQLHILRKRERKRTTEGGVRTTW